MVSEPQPLLLYQSRFSLPSIINMFQTMEAAVGTVNAIKECEDVSEVLRTARWFPPTAPNP